VVNWNLGFFGVLLVSPRGPVEEGGPLVFSPMRWGMF
jgi:hypothetical protein